MRYANSGVIEGDIPFLGFLHDEFNDILFNISTAIILTLIDNISLMEGDLFIRKLNNISFTSL